MTALDLAALRKLHAEATQGEWRVSDQFPDEIVCPDATDMPKSRRVYCYRDGHENAEHERRGTRRDG